MEAVQENTVIHAFKLMSEDNIRIGDIDLGQEEAKNLGLSLLGGDETPMALLYELIETHREGLAVWTDDCERPAGKLICWCSVTEEYFFVDSRADSEDLLLVLLGIEGGTESERHKCQWRRIQVVRFSQAGDHVRVLGQDLEFAMGRILDRAKVRIVNLEPAGSHDVLPKDKLLE